MKQTQTNELPRVWREVRWILANLRKSNKLGDVKGIDKWSRKLARWRDAHPQEAAAFVREWTRQ